MKYSYQTRGVCARKIEMEIEDGVIQSVQFCGGCAGNAQGLSKMVEGKPVTEIIETLKGIDCGGKGTSCPDQLAKALEEVK